MNLISIPSESCPHCEIPGGNCSMLVKEVDTLRAWDMNAKEKDYLEEMNSGMRPKSREAYIVHSFVCLQGKGKR